MQRYDLIRYQYTQKQQTLLLLCLPLVIGESFLEFFLRRHSPSLGTFLTFPLFFYGASFLFLKRKKYKFWLAFSLLFSLYLLFPSWIWLPFLLPLYRPFFPFLRRGKNGIAAGILYGLLMGTHLLLSLFLTKAFRWQLPSWQAALFPILVNAPLEELFYRKVLFAALRKYGFSFPLAAAFAVSSAFLRYAVNPVFFNSFLILGVGAIYLSFLHLFLCLLYEQTHSLSGTITANAIFGFSAAFLKLAL